MIDVSVSSIQQGSLTYRPIAMNEQPTPDECAACAPTVDMPPPNSTSDESSASKTGRIPVAVASDDDTGMTQETLSLLWQRLWLAGRSQYRYGLVI